MTAKASNLASEALLLGAAIAIERGVDTQELFLAETLESENARRLVVRELRRRHPGLAYGPVSDLVDDCLGHGVDTSRDFDAVERVVKRKRRKYKAWYHASGRRGISPRRWSR